MPGACRTLAKDKYVAAYQQLRGLLSAARTYQDPAALCELCKVASWINLKIVLYRIGGGQVQKHNVQMILTQWQTHRLSFCLPLGAPRSDTCAARSTLFVSLACVWSGAPLLGPSVASTNTGALQCVLRAVLLLRPTLATHRQRADSRSVAAVGAPPALAAWHAGWRSDQHRMMLLTIAEYLRGYPKQALPLELTPFFLLSGSATASQDRQRLAASLPAAPLSTGDLDLSQVIPSKWLGHYSAPCGRGPPRCAPCPGGLA